VSHSSANLTFDTLFRTSKGVMSPTTTTFFFSRSTSKEVTPADGVVWMASKMF
ncbi:hypothetical protein B296_00031924, partial [Ensete ventricosum]